LSASFPSSGGRNCEDAVGANHAGTELHRVAELLIRRDDRDPTTAYLPTTQLRPLAYRALGQPFR